MLCFPAVKTSIECDVEKISVQVTISLEVLISHVLTWFALLSVPSDSIVAEYQQSMLYVVKELTKDIVTLWQVKIYSCSFPPFQDLFNVLL